MAKRTRLSLCFPRRSASCAPGLEIVGLTEALSHFDQGVAPYGFKRQKEKGPPAE